MKFLLFLVLIFAVIFGLVVTQWGLPSGISYCNNLIKVEHGAETTGKIRYLELPSFSVIAECGDICQLEACTNCPPEEWICDE